MSLGVIPLPDRPERIDGFVLKSSYDRLQAENAKLRELVRELWTYAEQELVCDWTCSYGAACDWRDCVFKRRMRELGVEVDG